MNTKGIAAKSSRWRGLPVLLPEWSVFSAMYAALPRARHGVSPARQAQPDRHHLQGNSHSRESSPSRLQVTPAGCKIHGEGQMVEDFGALYSYYLLICLRLSAV